MALSLFVRFWFGSYQVASVLNNIGNLYMKMDDKRDVKKAKVAYEHALKIQEVVLGPDHPDTLRYRPF